MLKQAVRIVPGVYEMLYVCRKALKDRSGNIDWMNIFLNVTVKVCDMSRRKSKFRGF